jgi:peptidyl-prolyl cis-trans isomerase A (cyclophilin A)
MPRFAPGTAQGEFTIYTSDAPYMDANPNLPGDNEGYAVFGQVVEGLEVVRLIHVLPTGGTSTNPIMNGEMLAPPVLILSARRT